MSVQVTIKSASQSVEDFKIDCELTMTIGDLKEKLSIVYPSKPQKEQQKLIYGGKLLPDHLALNEALNKNQDIHIMHLVCPISKVHTEQKPSKKKTEANPSFAVPPSNPLYPQMNAHILGTQSLTSSDIPASANNAAFIPGTDFVQQYLALQQMMYAQFMTQYFSQHNGGMPVNSPYSPATPNVPQNYQPVQQPNVPANEHRQRQNEDERDYIDYLYIISRAIMFAVILYYYSSFSRIVSAVVIFLSIFMLIRCSRELQLQSIRNQNRRETAEVPANQPVPSEIETTENEEVSQDPAETPSTEQQTESWNISSVLSTVATLSASFFASLIPTDPVPVNAN